MQNFTVSKDAQIVDVSGLVQTESAQNKALQIGDSLASGTVLTLAQGSEITLVFEDGSEQKITGVADETLTSDAQATQQDTETAMAESQTANAENSDSVQADINAIQALIESGDDIELPDTAAGVINSNEGTDFVTLDRDGNELLAGAGYDTTEQDNIPPTAEEPELFARAAQPTITQSDTNTVEEDNVAIGNVLDNDSDQDDVLSVQSFTVAGDSTVYLAGQIAIVEGGSLLLNQDGSYSFTPAENFNGVLPVITYTTNTNASDTLTISVTPVSDLTDADESVSIAENTSVTGNVLTNAASADGTPVVSDFTINGSTFAVGETAELTQGNLTINQDGSYSFVPTDSFTGDLPVVTYTVSDGVNSDTSTLSINVTPVNKVPDAVDDTFDVNENTALNGALLGNDDLGDNPTTVTAFDSTSVNGGTVTVDAAGNFTYTPATDFVGDDTFTYTITDADGDTDTATVKVTVANVNKVPDAVDDTFDVNENTALNGALLGNDDLGDNPTTVTAFDSTSVNGGTVTVDAAGNFTYTPATDFVGDDTFTYTITDADGDTDTATVKVTVANVNKVPDAVDDTFDVNENTALNGALLGNDDLGDNPTTVTAFDSTSVNGGTVTVDAAGNFTYTPATDFVGDDTFTYTITDADGDTDTATVKVTVANVNKVPDAVDDTFDVNENTALNGALLGNDDLGDNPTTVTAFDSTSVNGGTVTVDAAGNFTYTPATDFVGDDTFTYTITDADGDTDTATVKVTVANVNKVPDAVDDTFDVNENTALNGALLGNDDLGDNPTTVTAFDSTSVNGGTVTVDAAGNFTYTPATDFVGDDTFTYTITDADGDTDTATVKVTVANVNKVPDAVDDTFDVNENTALNGALLGNDDLGDNPTTVTAFDSTSVNGGTVTVDAAGNFTYTPATDFVGDDTFTYTITDADGDTDTATVKVTVANVNKVPDAVDDTFDVNENTALNGALLGNDDLGDNPTTVTAFDSTSVNGGTVTVDAAGNFTYTPATDFVGDDTFTYTITDADGDTDTATVKVTVANVNKVPDAVDDTFDVNENTALNGALLGNDDLGDNPTTVTAFDSTSVNGGTVTVDAAGNFTYTPATDFVGDDTFTYTITDADGDTDTATVKVTVANVNKVPDAVDDTFDVNENTALNGALLGNDDLGDNPTTVTAFDSTSVNGGTVTVDAAGNFTYTPATDFVGDDTFTYTITDADGDTDTATVKVTVANVNVPPVAADDKFSVNEGSSVSGNIITHNDGDGVIDTDGGDGATLTVTQVNGVNLVFDVTTGEARADIKDGFILIKADGSFTYTHNGNDPVGAAPNFAYTLSDGTDVDTGNVTIEVAPVNDPPVAADDRFSVNEGSSVSGNIITHNDGDGVIDTDGGDGATMFITQVNGINLNFDPTSGEAIFTLIDGVLTAITPAEAVLLDDSSFNGENDNGILRINVEGEFTYESKGFLEGSTPPTFEYTLSDGINTDTARVIIAVETNGPIANDDATGFVFSENDSRTVKGNVTGLGRGSSGDVRDNFGLDSAGSPAITQVEYMGISYSLDASNTSENPIKIETDFGNLFIDNKGSYRFVEKEGLTLVDLPFDKNGKLLIKFTYTIQDGDNINPDTDTADLSIVIAAPSMSKSKDMPIDIDQATGTIDTALDEDSLSHADEAAFVYEPDIDGGDLSGILIDGNTEGLEKYLMMMGDNEDSADNADLAGALNDPQVEEGVVLEKGQQDSEHAFSITVTNGLLASGATVISDTAASPTNAPIAELDSSELL